MLTQLIRDVSELAGLPPSMLSPFKAFRRAVDSGPPLILSVPKDHCAVVVNVELDGYPVIGGISDPSKRQPFGYLHETFIDWTHAGLDIDVVNSNFLNYRGSIFYVFDQGRVTANCSTTPVGTDTAVMNLTLTGFFLPRTALAKLTRHQRVVL